MCTFNTSTSNKFQRIRTPSRAVHLVVVGCVGVRDKEEIRTHQHKHVALARVCLCVGNSRLLPIFFPNFGCFALVAWFAPIQRGSSGTWRTRGGGGGGPLWRSTGVVPLEDQHHRTHQSPGTSPSPLCVSPQNYTLTPARQVLRSKKKNAFTLSRGPGQRPRGV